MPRNRFKRNKMNRSTKAVVVLAVPLMCVGVAIVSFMGSPSHRTPKGWWDRSVAINQPIDLATVKPCQHEYPTLGETYPCKWDPTAQGHYADGDPTTVIVMFRPEDGCPMLPLGAVCMDVETFDDHDSFS
jgi:hypothetical protein